MNNYRSSKRVTGILTAQNIIIITQSDVQIVTAFKPLHKFDTIHRGSHIYDTHRYRVLTRNNIHYYQSKHYKSILKDVGIGFWSIKINVSGKSRLIS